MQKQFESQLISNPNLEGTYGAALETQGNNIPIATSQHSDDIFNQLS